MMAYNLVVRGRTFGGPVESVLQVLIKRRVIRIKDKFLANILT